MKLFSNLTVRMSYFPLNFIIFLWSRLPLELEQCLIYLCTPWCLNIGIQYQYLSQTPCGFVFHLLFSRMLASPSQLFTWAAYSPLLTVLLCSPFQGYYFYFYWLRVPVLKNIYVIVSRILSSNYMVILHPRVNNAIAKSCLETLQIWSCVWILNSLYDMFYISYLWWELIALMSLKLSMNNWFGYVDFLF